MSLVSEPPIGVVLAGGAGRRIGGDKALVRLGGRPLIAYPLAAMRAAVGEAGVLAVVAKPDTHLPDLPDGVSVWREPAEPRHPVVGIAHALERAGGRPVLVCAADMPFVTADVLAGLVQAEAGDALAVVAVLDGAPQPHLARYEPGALPSLTAAAAGRRPLRDIVAELEPRPYRVADPRVVFNVNTPEDLAEAEAGLGS
jgi:molybdopterin-guanine dinucleotide biosynthesis protein A